MENSTLFYRGFLTCDDILSVLFHITQRDGRVGRLAPAGFGKRAACMSTFPRLLPEVLVGCRRGHNVPHTSTTKLLYTVVRVARLALRRYINDINLSCASVSGAVSFLTIPNSYFNGRLVLISCSRLAIFQKLLHRQSHSLDHGSEESRPLRCSLHETYIPTLGSVPPSRPLRGLSI